MKKVLLLLLFVTGSATFLSAEVFKIDITGITVYVNGKATPIDSVKIGDKVTLTITLQNDGGYPVKNGQYRQDSFPGGTYYFNYNAGVGAVNESKKDFYHPIILSGMAYDLTQTVQDTFTVTAAFFKPGQNNIVIIWPSGGKVVGSTDTTSLDTTVIAGNYEIYVYPEVSTAGISQTTQNNSFKIYPNPAKDVVNIQMNESGTGLIRLMDMTGKLIASKPYAAKAGESINLPLNEGAVIPDGLYLISIETGNSSNVSKIMICR